MNIFVGFTKKTMYAGCCTQKMKLSGIKTKQTGNHSGSSYLRFQKKSQRGEEEIT